jgi:ABC-type multidrug transport system fused ATPase/permease subunit
MHASNQLSGSFGDGDVLLWMLEFFLFVIWFWLLLTIFGDLFRDPDVGGGMKAVWIIVLVVLPYLGILIYLIARGHGMARRAAAQQARMQEQLNAQIRSVASTSSAGAGAADQIAQAKSLLDSGAITQAEFDQLKTKALSS